MPVTSIGKALLALALGLAAMLPATRATAEIRVEAGYSAPADLFSLMDNVALWWEGFNDPAYRDWWEEEWGWSEEDEAWAERYGEYRLRSYSDPGQEERDPATARDGLFAKLSSFSEEADPLAAHFVNSASVEEALASLDEAAAPQDAEMLAGFYAHFEPRWRILLAESENFAGRAAGLQEKVTGPAVDAYLERIGAFYQVDIERAFNAYFVWWPPIDRTAADITGRTFFIRSHPIAHADQDGWEEVIMHEVVHYISAHQDPAQKRALTDSFLQTCPAQISTGSYDLLEEPLAVAIGNAGFAKFGTGIPLPPEESWYYRPMPSLMGRLLWDDFEALYESEATIEDGIVARAADYCSQLLWLSSVLEEREAPVTQEQD